ncbi:methyl-CpG-binding domain protein 4 [Carex littledalei]|uniref:Methyl-CpG-binding domain protein 4 n=1 Tax=Carex littledalei TaxID=544730 RepID=A0A833VTH6_9POAL|nr:methyl-CpG-binding domain protein 4 [Carex littledalei]
MALKSKRVAQMAAEEEDEEGGKEGRKGMLDLLDSFRYTGTGSRAGGGGGGRDPCWIPSLSVIHKRKPIPTNPTPPSTPSPLKRTWPTAFPFAAEKKPKKPRHDLPKEAAAAPPPLITAAVKKPKKPHDLPKETADTSSGACAVNVKKVIKSRNLPKTAVAVNVNTVKKKKTTPFRAAEKRSEAYCRVPPDFDFKLPRSCHHLIQEDHSFDHWRVLVICMLLNMTTGKQVKKVVEDFFVLCPDAETTTEVDAQQIQNVISTLGLHNKRAHMIKRLSEEYLRPDWAHVTSLHGIGKYAADAYAIFCTGKGADVRPQDHKLVDYWNSIYGNDTSIVRATLDLVYYLNVFVPVYIVQKLREMLMVKLYERCLIPCSNYPEFWTRYMVAKKLSIMPLVARHHSSIRVSRKLGIPFVFVPLVKKALLRSDFDIAAQNWTEGMAQCECWSTEGRVSVHHLGDSQHGKDITFKCHRDGQQIYFVNLGVTSIMRDSTAGTILKLNTTADMVPPLVQYHCRYNLQLLSSAWFIIL